MFSRIRRRRFAALTAALALFIAGAVFALHVNASASEKGRCPAFAAASKERRQADTGRGDRVVVIGDSYSVGLGLNNPESSWPTRLQGRVHVAGFSGSGFSKDASPCGAVSYADRAAAAVGRGAELVVVEGGLNDWDRPAREVRTGFARLLRKLDGQRVLIVGPAKAPARVRGAVRIDALLARLAARNQTAYLSVIDLDLRYLDDRLHLTAAGHRMLGDAVATEVLALSNA